MTQNLQQLIVGTSSLKINLPFFKHCLYILQLISEFDKLVLTFSECKRHIIHNAILAVTINGNN